MAGQSGGLGFAKKFQEPGYGYFMEYPLDWVYETQTGKTIIFSGPSGTKAWYSTVSIQNVLTTKGGGKYADVDALVAEFKSQLNKSGDARFSSVEAVTYHKNNITLPGKQFIAEYTKDKERFKQWLIILSRSNGNILHAWFYTSPIGQYDEFLGIAKSMLESWTYLE
jgi:hypothetical protein